MNYQFVCSECGKQYTGYKNLRVCAHWKGGCGGRLRRVVQPSVTDRIVAEARAWVDDCTMEDGKIMICPDHAETMKELLNEIDKAR